jgi:hypothetical protein
VIFLGAGVVEPRARRRSLNGEAGSAWVVGGEGSWLGGASIDCRARHVE